MVTEAEQTRWRRMRMDRNESRSDADEHGFSLTKRELFTFIANRFWVSPWWD